MTRLAAPLIIDAHLERLPTLEGWDAADERPAVRVFEGAREQRTDLRRWLTVGYLSGDAGPAVHLEPTHDAQSQNVEAGSIGCELIVAGADVATARAAAFDLLAPWSGWLQRESTLPNSEGQARLLPGSALSLIADVLLATTRAGATATAVVTITYTAMTYG
jgi:hypothetical protein